MEITSFEKVEVSSSSLLSSSLPDLHYQSLQTLQQQQQANYLTQTGQHARLPYLSAENLVFAAASADSSGTALGIGPPLPSSSGNSSSGGVAIAPVSSSSSSGQQQHPDHYKNLKMKYYRSLGVQNGAAAVSNTGSVPSSLPNNTGSQLMEQRARTHTVTVPSAIVRQMVPPNRDTPMSPRKKRSTSTPIPITMPQPIPGAPNRNAPTFSSDEEEEEEEEIPDLQQHEFIPPHEMLAKQHQNGFAVGTAHSVAVWEQKRRNMMNVNV